MSEKSLTLNHLKAGSTALKMDRKIKVDLKLLEMITQNA